MSQGKYGIQFGNTDAINNPDIYTSTRNRLQIDLTNNAPLFNVKTVPAGSAFSVSFNVAQTITEQLLLINHNLGYIPEVYTVFTLTLLSTGVASSYALGQIFIANGGGGADYINYTATANTLQINHVVVSYGFGGGGSYTSTANLYNLTVKYLICNNLGIQSSNYN